MALKITKASDPITVQQLVLCLYGFPGSWKTSLAQTADAPLTFDFDSGIYRAKYRKDSVPVTAWSDVTSVTQEDLEPYRTIVVDTAGRALDSLAADIIRRDPKMGRGGALTLQGFGKLKAEFTAWLKNMRAFGKDVVLLAHVDEQRSGDEIVERIDAQGASKNEIYKSSDAMGRIAIRDGKRLLLFSPTDTAFGKNPAGMEPIPIPTFGPDSRFLGEVIESIKSTLNAMTSEQSEVTALLLAWSERLHAATGTKSLNKLLKDADGLDARIVENAKRLLWQFAKEHSFQYDKAAGGFIEKPAEKTEAA
jgi:hypothetical protein